MGKSAHELFPGHYLFLQLADGLLQRLRHMVKILRQLPQLVAADLSGTIPVVPGRHLSCGLHQQPDRLRQPGSDKVHDYDPQNEHQHHQPPVDRKPCLSLLKHLGHIPERLQIQNPAKRIDTAARLDIIPIPLSYHPVSIHILFRLLQQGIVRLKTVAGIEHLFSFIGKPQQAPAALPARLQIGSDLFHGSVLQQIVLKRHIQRRRLKGEPQYAVLVQRLIDLTCKRGPEHIVHKIEPAQAQRNCYDDRRPKQ